MAINSGDNDAFVNNASRIGVKGSVGEDGSLTGFYNIQMAVNADNGDANLGTSALSSRFAFAGVKGGFGKVVVGRLSSPYKMAGLKTDPFYDTSAGPTNSGSNYGLSSLTNGFLNNVVGYVSPKLGGSVTLNAVAVLAGLDNETTPAGTGDNMFNIGATYNSGPITAALQHITEMDATRLSAGYKAGAFGVGFSYETVDNVDLNAATTDDFTQTYLSGTYKVAPKTTLAASIGQVADNGTGARNSAGDGFTVGVFQKIAKKTTVNLIHSSVNYDGATADRDVTSLGFVQKF